MSKGNTWQKVKMAKHRANLTRQAHGGYARFSPGTVELREATGRWYDGDNTQDRFRPIREQGRKQERQGEWHNAFEPVEPTPENRRDGAGKSLPDERKPIVAKDGERFVKWTGAKRERLDSHRLSMGQPLIAANWRVGQPELLTAEQVKARFGR